ncbi:MULTISPECIES: YsnF/AvaK domain-containing protein [Tenebrionibacter/Tenebrionicola group]|jgi:stress response protein YsnF|uniref:DUF2382 domain-containing protein n=2 Tax=Tenebrionibacter/Tenebrionicola group TaxID=2969848 RepID=A0A8K0V414_9ENTR|nr:MULTISPECIES: DUF2382 domain-containing protein [Tenebrionibacter/Tenebrionicola group]MBK4715018.1 DUF2382 domain-containing protein [Tenebrionibacter intestinalis]MBV4414188.1 DUF2382 domain-containing protein [Tenebrionicola larvae]MBV5095641.1 DUF2382 domain-containing protein [Tenebrionicola larvae]
MTDNERPHPTDNEDNTPQVQRIPVYNEKVQIDKETVCHGKVIVKRNTLRQQVTVSENISHQDAIIEVVPIGKYVDSIPQHTENDDVIVIPVYEEHTQIVKRVYLKEEIRITKKKTVHPFEQLVEVKQQVISVTREKK